MSKLPEESEHEITLEEAMDELNESMGELEFEFRTPPEKEKAEPAWEELEDKEETEEESPPEAEEEGEEETPAETEEEAAPAKIEEIEIEIEPEDKGLLVTEFINKAQEMEKKLEEKLLKIEKEKQRIHEMSLPKRIDISDDLKELLEKNLLHNKEMEKEIHEVMNVVRAFETKEPLREEDFLIKLDKRIKELGRIVSDFSSDDLRKEIVVLKVAMDQMNRRVVDLTSEMRRIEEDGHLFELLGRIGEKLEDFELSLSGREGTSKLLRELKHLGKEVKNITNYYENRIPDDWSDIKNDLDVTLQKLAEIDLRIENMEINQESIENAEKKIGKSIDDELRQLKRLVGKSGKVFQ